jgi:hypothetical protein
LTSEPPWLAPVTPTPDSDRPPLAALTKFNPNITKQTQLSAISNSCASSATGLALTKRLPWGLGARGAFDSLLCCQFPALPARCRWELGAVRQKEGGPGQVLNATKPSQIQPSRRRGARPCSRPRAASLGSWFFCFANTKTKAASSHKAVLITPGARSASKQ